MTDIDTTTTWIVQQVDVAPRTFLGVDGTWGNAACAIRYATEEEAVCAICPDGTSGMPMRLSYHPHRAF